MTIDTLLGTERQRNIVGMIALQFLLRFQIDFSVSIKINLLMYLKGHQTQRGKESLFLAGPAFQLHGSQVCKDGRYPWGEPKADLGLSPDPVSFWLADFGQVIRPF